ncbi:PP0621 family protein [Candidatus Dactylopiibacterium carminicum]|uniref:PP0621 family protein n=1 Tax=Candidatus Dactylopiibacterium carminicum TaxID=857335 RepID=UPI000BA9EE2E
MHKLILFLLVLFVIYRLRRWWLRKEPASQSTGTTKLSGVDREPAEPIRACVRCGLLVPESEGAYAAGKFYCCAEHAQQER